MRLTLLVYAGSSYERLEEAEVGEGGGWRRRKLEEAEYTQEECPSHLHPHLHPHLHRMHLHMYAYSCPSRRSDASGADASAASNGPVEPLWRAAPAAPHAPAALDAASRYHAL